MQMSSFYLKKNSGAYNTLWLRGLVWIIFNCFVARGRAIVCEVFACSNLSHYSEGENKKKKKSFLTPVAQIRVHAGALKLVLPCCGAHFGSWSRRGSGRPRRPRPKSLRTCDSGSVRSSPRQIPTPLSHILQQRKKKTKHAQRCHWLSLMRR